MDVHVASLDDEASRLLDAGASWTLFARFERAVVIARSADSALVSVVRHDVADGPYTVRLDRSAPTDLRVFDEPPRLERAAAKRWRADPVSAREAVDHDELARRLHLLDLISERAVRPDRGYAAVIPPVDLAALETSLAKGDSHTAAVVAARIAGLGPGLTPSGDDLLAGALAFHAWAEAAGCLRDGGVLRAAVRDAAVPRTTRIAGQLMHAAARGQVTAPLAALLFSLFARIATFPPDLAALLAIGETSGADLLAGVRLAGRAIRRREPAAEGALLDVH